jgi:hypothetical protein
MKFETPDGVSINVEKLAKLFPAAVGEGKVNFDMLRTLLGDEVYADEAYEFTWVGKRKAIREAGKAVKEIARRQPLRAVFRDSSFANSPSKINVEAIFKLLAPNTSVKVL